MAEIGYGAYKQLIEGLAHTTSYNPDEIAVSLTWRDLCALAGSNLADNPDVNGLNEKSVDRLLEFVAKRIPPYFKEQLMEGDAYLDSAIISEIYENPELTCADCDEVILGERAKTPCGKWIHAEELDDHIDECQYPECLQAKWEADESAETEDDTQTSEPAEDSHLEADYEDRTYIGDND